MTAWLRRRLLHHLRRRGERGTVLVIVAGVMTALMASGAVAIDMSAGRASQQQAQSAADAAALATEDAIIAGNGSTATTAGINTGLTNMPGSTVSVTTSPTSTSTAVRATVSASSSNGLGQLLGSSSTRVSATAGADVQTIGGTPAGVFASDTGCGLFDQPGVNVAILGNLTVNGNVTTNGSVTSVLFSSINVNGTVTYGCSSGSLLGSINANAYVRGSTTNAFPLNYAATYPNPCVNPPSGVTETTITTALQIGSSFLNNIPNGIVCDTLPLNIIGSISGNYTFVAPSITIGISGTSLTPASASLPTFWATSGDVNLAVASATTGTIYAPNGAITLTVAGASLTGYLEAQEVALTAASAVVNGTGPVTGGTQIAGLTQ